MSSFYEKLSVKFQDGGISAPGTGTAPAKTVTFNATGDRTSPKKADVPAATPPTDVTPDGADPIDVDLFQSETRTVVFMQLSGIPANELAVTVSEESNTIIVEAAQKRPGLPPLPGAKEGEPPEKGIYVKAEVKWRSLYRKIYLPAPFDISEATATLDKGVLIIVLPAKHPGVGKKMVVQEIRHDEQKK